MISKRRTEYLLLSASFCFLLLGSILQFFWDDWCRFIVAKQKILSNRSFYYDHWVKNPAEIRGRFYLFNWTNPSYMMENGYKPEFSEVGPYIFREKSEKVDIVWNENGTVTYKKVFQWFFDSDKSNGTLSDNITTLNVVALSAVHVTRQWSTMSKLPLTIAIAGTQIIQETKTVQEFLFEGYSNTLLDAGSQVPGISSMVPFSRFAWFYQMNGSSSVNGVYNIETGVNGMSSYGQIRKWNHKSHTDYFQRPCGEVFGYDGELWPSGLTEDDDLVIFSVDICRYIRFIFKEVVFIKGIQGYRYEAGPDLFDNGTADPKNECFCGGECLPSGVLNVSACRFGAPGFISYPNFKYADPIYLSKVRINKAQNSHWDDEIYIVLEPTHGVPLELSVQLQLNMYLRPYKDIGMFKRVPEIMFPILWINNKATIPDFIATPFKIALALPAIGMVFSSTMIVTGLVVFALFLTSRREINLIDKIWCTKRDTRRTTTDSSNKAAMPLMRSSLEEEITIGR